MRAPDGDLAGPSWRGDRSPPHGQHPGTPQRPGRAPCPQPGPERGAERGTGHRPSAWAWLRGSRVLQGRRGWGPAGAGAHRDPPSLGEEMPAQPACAGIGATSEPPKGASGWCPEHQTPRAGWGLGAPGPPPHPRHCQGAGVLQGELPHGAPPAMSPSSTSPCPQQTDRAASSMSPQQPFPSQVCTNSVLSAAA